MILRSNKMVINLQLYADTLWACRAVFVGEEADCVTRPKKLKEKTINHWSVSPQQEVD